MDVIVVSDLRDVRDCRGVSEEEPAFIPNSFVIEEVHGCCWSLFTDTQDSMVRLVPPSSAPALTTIHLQEKIMAALIFCSDVHKTGPSRRSSLTNGSTGILSVSRIPRLSMGHTS